MNLQRQSGLSKPMAGSEEALLGKGTTREQLLHLASLQAQVQGKSLTQYLRELQSLAERTSHPWWINWTVSTSPYLL